MERGRVSRRLAGKGPVALTHLSDRPRRQEYKYSAMHWTGKRVFRMTVRREPSLFPCTRVAEAGRDVPAK